MKGAAEVRQNTFLCRGTFCEEPEALFRSPSFFEILPMMISSVAQQFSVETNNLWLLFVVDKQEKRNIDKNVKKNNNLKTNIQADCEVSSLLFISLQVQNQTQIRNEEMKGGDRTDEKKKR
jgi:hypothetical protein